MNITEIEALTEAQAKEMAEEVMDIKGHSIYFIDFGGYFKYSVCVFLNGKHIYHANDYELHHTSRDREWLRQWYIDTLNHKLYTETEIVEPIKDYDDYEAKSNYLRNYYALQKDYISIFRINPTDEEEREFQESIKGMTYDPVAFCYIADKEFVVKHISLMNALVKRKTEKANSYEYYVDAFVKEMYNHEYSINWDGDADVLSVFGSIPRELTWNSEYTLNDLFDAVGFNDVQRQAYRDAKKKYYKQIGEAA